MGLREVAHAQGGGVAFAGGAHGRPSGEPAAEAVGEEGDFGGEVVDGVDHGVGMGAVEELGKVVVGYAEAFGGGAAGGGDGTEARLGDLGLWAAKIRVGGEGLAVEVGLLKGVGVHQPKSAEAASGESLDAGAADGAQSHHEDIGGVEACHGLGAKESFGAEVWADLGGGGSHGAYYRGMGVRGQSKRLSGTVAAARKRRGAPTRFWIGGRFTSAQRLIHLGSAADPHRTSGRSSLRWPEETKKAPTVGRGFWGDVMAASRQRGGRTQQAMAWS